MKKIILVAVVSLTLLAGVWFFFFRTYEVADDIFEGITIQEIEEATINISLPDGSDLGGPGPRPLTESELNDLKDAMQNTTVRRSDAFNTFSSFADRTINFTARTEAGEGVYETKSYTIHYASPENLFQFGGEGPGIKTAWKYKEVNGKLTDYLMSFDMYAE